MPLVRFAQMRHLRLLLGWNLVVQLLLGQQTDVIHAAGSQVVDNILDRPNTSLRASARR